ncbi:MAG: hypothetical protein QM779_12390 [Propionicimonas sp.]|uniref:hypothetical protein n=1 Tax=Propionicimonas sp. TaxID=1955623 RepID=UPI003D0C3BCD
MRTRPARLLIALLGLGLVGCAATPPATTPGSSSPSPVVTTASATPSLTATPTPTPTTSASSTPAEQDDIQLRGDGIGAYAFGAKEVDVTALLEATLGDADESNQGIKCELDESSPWARTVSWGTFWVEYDAKDGSKKSPRTLAAWGVSEGATLAEGMSVQDDVPLDLTFSELKAKYPEGKTKDLGLGDGSKRFILPNKIFFVGAGNKPDHMQAGAFSTCE